MLVTSSAFAFLSLVIIFAQADNTFYSPPSVGFNVTQGSQLVVNWTTEWGAVPISLAAYQNNGAGSWVSSQLLDNSIDPGSYVWTAEPLQTLPIAYSFHFCLWFGDASQSSDLTDNNSFNSGAVFIEASATTSAAIEYSSARTASSMDSPPTTSSMTSSALSQPSSTTSANPSGNTSPGISSDQLGNAANISTIVGSVIGGVFAVFTFVLAWLGFRKDKNGNRVIPEKIKTVRRNLSHHGGSHNSRW